LRGERGFLAKFDPQSSLLVLFSFVLANESTPLLLLFTFGSAFVRKCEQKQSTLINFINYFLLVLFSFALVNESTPLSLLLFTFGSVFVRECEQKQSTLIINYFLLVLFSFVLANESMMPPIFIHFLLDLFLFILTNESNPSHSYLLLLFTFSSAFVRTCERIHSNSIF